jgi:endonuclease/exonuclease/phosphatase family metal-dependent hydrolase
MVRPFDTASPLNSTDSVCRDFAEARDATYIGLLRHPMGQHLVSMTAAILSVTAVLGAQPSSRFLGKPAAASVRVLTWNIYRSSIFPQDGEAVDVSASTRPAQFARVLRALKPDVLCLQQVTESGARSAALVNHILPLSDGKSWQAHSAVDTVILSRFSISGRAAGEVGGERPRGHAIAMIDTPATELYLICAHFQSSDDREDVPQRRQQAEMIASTIRQAKAGGGAIPLRARTPFMVLGDFNAIPGATLFVDALVTGKAPYPTADKRTEGLDWDHAWLTDALPRHNASGSKRYTWRNDLEQFPPGILDRILYSDSVLASPQSVRPEYHRDVVRRTRQRGVARH